MTRSIGLPLSVRFSDFFCFFLVGRSPFWLATVCFFGVACAAPRTNLLHGTERQAVWPTCSSCPSATRAETPTTGYCSTIRGRCCSPKAAAAVASLPTGRASDCLLAGASERTVSPPPPPLQRSPVSLALTPK